MIHLMSHAQYTWSSLECLMMCDYLRPDQLIDHQTVIKTKDFFEWVGPAVKFGGIEVGKLFLQ